MSRKWEEQTGSFEAQGGDGRQYTLYVFTTFHEAWNGSGYDRVAGLKSIRLGDGRSVNRVDKGRYEIVGRPMIPLTSDDPAAP